VLPPLPWAPDSLTNFMSAESIDYHFNGYHKGYYNMLNALAAKDPSIGKMTLQQLVEKMPIGPVFNNAAQAWNHDFFWKCMSPNGGGDPTGEIGKLIVSNYGSVDGFKRKFMEVTMAHFASGWTWLIQKKGRKLDIISLPNAENPLSCHKYNEVDLQDDSGRRLLSGQSDNNLDDKMHGNPLLTLDLWEHAYYVDHRINRDKYCTQFWNYINWSFVNENVLANY